MNNPFANLLVAWLYYLSKGALAIRRIFSLVDMIENLNFQIALMFFKLDCFGSKICIESIKIGFKAIHRLPPR